MPEPLTKQSKTDFSKNTFSFTSVLWISISVDCFVVVSHQNYVRLAKQNKRVQFKSLDCWLGQQFYQSTKANSGVWTLGVGTTHSPAASVITFEISVMLLTTVSSCERPNWTMRRRKYDFMLGSILITRSSSCHWTCVKSFHFISCWFDRGKIFGRGKNSIDEENSVFVFWMYSKNIGIVGFVANLLSSIAFTTCAPSLSKEKCGYLHCVRPSIWRFRSVRQSRRLAGGSSWSWSSSWRSPRSSPAAGLFPGGLQEHGNALHHQHQDLHRQHQHLHH